MIRLILPLILALLFPVQSHATRLFTTGLEENDLTNTMFTSIVGNTPTIDTTLPHSGTYRMNTSATAANSIARFTMSQNKTSGTVFTRFYFLTSTATPS